MCTYVCACVVMATYWGYHVPINGTCRWYTEAFVHVCLSSNSHLPKLYWASKLDLAKRASGNIGFTQALWRWRGFFGRLLATFEDVYTMYDVQYTISGWLEEVEYKFGTNLKPQKYNFHINRYLTICLQRYSVNCSVVLQIPYSCACNPTSLHTYYSLAYACSLSWHWAPFMRYLLSCSLFTSNKYLFVYFCRLPI